MIIKIGDMFSTSAKTLVNTVNCVGVMGKGIAEVFKKQYPEMYKEYALLCADGQVKPGVPYYYQDLTGNSIINFPTKEHWKSPSKLSYIVSGLKWFRDNFKSLGITSIAFPPLGCGNGGLPWKIVGPAMYLYLHDLPIDIEIYAPYGTPKEQLTEEYLLRKNVRFHEVTGALAMGIDKSWYLILYVVKALNDDQYVLPVGRVILQKICYVLTREGITTGFHFVKGTYGPYAKEVNTAITALSNANLMTEVQYGKMIKTQVSKKFKLERNIYTDNELDIADRTIDLFSRVKNTEQAEIMITIMFAFDSMVNNKKKPSENDIFNYVLDWKPRWNPSKKKEIALVIRNLSELRWISPEPSLDLISMDDEFF